MANSNNAIKTRLQFKGKYQSLVIRRGHKESVIAIGHKMMGVDRPYTDPKIDYDLR